MTKSSRLLLAFTILCFIVACARQAPPSDLEGNDSELATFLDRYGSNSLAGRGARGTSPVYNGFEGAVLYGYHEGSKNICTRWDLNVSGSGSLSLVRLVRNETGDVASAIGNDLYIGSWTGYGKDGLIFHADSASELTVSGTVSFCHSPGMEYVSFRVPANRALTQKTFLNGAVVIKIGSRQAVLESRPVPSPRPFPQPTLPPFPWQPNFPPIRPGQGSCAEWLRQCEANKPTGGQHPTYCQCFDPF